MKRISFTVTLLLSLIVFMVACGDKTDHKRDVQTAVLSNNEILDSEENIIEEFDEFLDYKNLTYEKVNSYNNTTFYALMQEFEQWIIRLAYDDNGMIRDITDLLTDIADKYFEDTVDTVYSLFDGLFDFEFTFKYIFVKEITSSMDDFMFLWSNDFLDICECAYGDEIYTPHYDIIIPLNKRLAIEMAFLYQKYHHLYDHLWDDKIIINSILYINTSYYNVHKITWDMIKNNVGRSTPSPMNTIFYRLYYSEPDDLLDSVQDLY